MESDNNSNKSWESDWDSSHSWESDWDSPTSLTEGKFGKFPENPACPPEKNSEIVVDETTLVLTDTQKEDVSLMNILANATSTNNEENIFGTALCASTVPDVSTQNKNVSSSSSCTATESTIFNNDDLLTRLRIGLQAKYAALTMEGLPWIEDSAVSLDNFVPLKLVENSGCTVELDEVFESDNTAMHRETILIKGGPGYGKTSLVSKILYDWSNGKQYVEHFHLALLLSYEQCKSSFEETLVSSLVEFESDTEELLTFLSDEKLQVLVLFDGLDQIPQGCKLKFLPLWEAILFGDLFHFAGHFRIIVTSRSGSLSLLDKTMDEAINLQEICCKWFQINGIEKEKRKMFLKCYLKVDDEASIESEMCFVNELVPNEMLQCPLFLLMTIVICGSPHQNGKVFERRTELYKGFHDFVIRRYEVKLHPKENISELTIFGTENEFTRTLFKLGELSLNVLKRVQIASYKDELLAKCNQDIPVTELGIIIETDVGTYEPIHSSMQQFWAAFYLWICFRKSPEMFFSIIASVWHLIPSNMLFSFLVGLMGNDAHFLFAALEPFGAKISSCFNVLPRLLLECTLKEKTFFERLKHFFPVLWKIDWFENNAGFFITDTHKLVVDAALTSGQTKGICWHLKCAAQFPQVLKVDSLWLILEENTWMNNLLALKNVSVECRNLICSVNTVCDTDSDNWLYLKTVLTDITCKNISFHLHYYRHIDLLHTLCHDILTNVFQLKKLKWITCQMDLETSFDLSHLTDVVRRNLVHGIGIFISGDYTDSGSEDISDSSDSSHNLDSDDNSETKGSSSVFNRVTKMFNFNNSDSDEMYDSDDSSRLVNRVKKAFKFVYDSDEDSDDSSRLVNRVKNGVKFVFDSDEDSDYDSTFFSRVRKVFSRSRRKRAQVECDNLIKAAAKSDSLKKIIFRADSGRSHTKNLPTIDLDKLCNAGKKSWEFLQIDSDFGVTCSSG